MKRLLALIRLGELSDARRFLLALATMFYVFAIVNYFEPHVPEQTRRYNLLFVFFYSWLGKYGISLAWTVLGTAMVGFGYLTGRK